MMSSAEGPAAVTVPDIPTLAGGYIISFALAFLVYGLTVAQAYSYLQTCDEDPRWMKWLAGIVFFLETVQSGFLFRELYFYTVLCIGNPANLARIDWSVPVVLISDSLIGFAVEIFYIHRMWSFSRNIYLTVVAVILLLGWKAGLLYVCTGTIRYPTWPAVEGQRAFKKVVIFTLACVLALDSSIATTMVYYLTRNRSLVRRTRDVVNWLIIYSVNTGAILVAMSSCALITYLSNSESFLFHGFIIIVFKLYASSLFGALNTKHLLRKRLNREPVIFSSNVHHDSTALSTLKARPVHVEITSTHEISRDTGVTLRDERTAVSGKSEEQMKSSSLGDLDFSCSV